MLKSLFENTVENFLQPFEAVFNKIAPVTWRSDYHPHIHTHTFPEGTSLEDRNQFLKDIAEIYSEIGLEPNFHAIKEGEKFGFEFYFNTAEENEKFIRAAFGDLQGIEEHCHILYPANYQHLEYSLTAAKQWLDVRGVKYKIEIGDDKLHFKFDRFSDRRNFERFVEDGRLDKSIRQLEKDRQDQGIILGLD